MRFIFAAEIKRNFTHKNNTTLNKMKKNLFEKETVQEIISRVENLNQESKILWGEMNATEMLHHCNLANLQIIHENQKPQKTKFKQYLIRFLSLYVVPNFPKNLKGSPLNDTKGKIDLNKFEEEKKKFIAIISEFPQKKDPVKLMHPSFGYINTKQWGKAAWMHMDHHLRQFGV